MIPGILLVLNFRISSNLDNTAALYMMQAC
jgi:hypothetical protein